MQAEAEAAEQTCSATCGTANRVHLPPQSVGYAVLCHCLCIPFWIAEQLRSQAAHAAFMGAQSTMGLSYNQQSSDTLFLQQGILQQGNKHEQCAKRDMLTNSSTQRGKSQGPWRQAHSV